MSIYVRIHVYTHVAMLPVLRLIPPPAYCGGWLCFVMSIGSSSAHAAHLEVRGSYKRAHTCLHMVHMDVFEVSQSGRVLIAWMYQGTYSFTDNSNGPPSKGVGMEL